MFVKISEPLLDRLRHAIGIEQATRTGKHRGNVVKKLGRYGDGKAAIRGIVLHLDPPSALAIGGADDPPIRTVEHRLHTLDSAHLQETEQQIKAIRLAIVDMQNDGSSVRFRRRCRTLRAFAKARRLHAIAVDERIVEAADRGKPTCIRDACHGEFRVCEQAFCKKQTTCFAILRRWHTVSLLKQAAQMTLRRALLRGNPSDGSIPGPLPHARGGACNRMVDVGRNRGSRRKLGAAFQARPIPRRFRLGSSFEERAVFALGHLRPAYAHATVNSRRGNADEKQAVEMRIP